MMKAMLIQKKLFLLFGIVSFFILNVVVPINAQEIEASSEADTPTPIPTIIAPNSPIRLTVSPPTIFLDTKPGKSVQTTLKVYNNGDDTELLETKLMTFTAQATGSEPQLRDFEPGDVAKDWLVVSPKQFSLEPQKWQTLNIDFSPPSTAGLAYYYALVIRRASTIEAAAGESTIQGAAAVLLLTKVSVPYEKQELQLLSFSTSRKVYEYLPVEFSIEIKNTGNIHLAPVGDIFIDDAKKNDVGTIELNRSIGVILPNSTRTYRLDWNDGFPRYESESLDGRDLKDEQGKPKKKLVWDFSQANKVRIGKYTAHLVFIYDNGERDIPTEAVVSFWVIPWKILLVILFVSLLALLGLLLPFILLFKRRKKKTKLRRN